VNIFIIGLLEILLLTYLLTYLLIYFLTHLSFVSVCQTDLMALDHLLDLFARKFFVSIRFLFVLVIPTCGRLRWPAFWSTFGRTIK